MNCELRQDLLIEYALGTLESPELEELRAHLNEGCPVCEGRLAESQTLFAMLPLGLPAVKAPPGARQRLSDRIGRVDDGRQSVAASPIKISQGSRSRGAWWIGAMIGAAAAACVTILVYSNILSTERAKLASAKARLAQKDIELRQVRDSATDAEQMLHLIDSPAVKIVNLAGSPNQAGGKARFIWDPETQTLCLCVWSLKPLPAGKGYELWLFRDGHPQPLPAATFLVDAKGDKMMRFKLEGDAGKVVQVAITDEPYNDGKGLPAPSGNIQFKQGL